MLDKAIQVAINTHKGQKDLAGEPYILHPLRVMLQMETDIARIVAVLHDVIEDGGIEILLEADFPSYVVGNVFILTRAAGESYKGYIEKVSWHELPTSVKLADLKDNLDPVRTALLDPIKNAKRREKYLQSKEYLLLNGRF
jgi:GTP diphosphokinase / guanosine-3',5'-bis(diphosphate) 3'-diphosphatase